MSLVLIGISLFLTFHTAAIAIKIWNDGNKPAGVFIAALALCFLPLTFLNM